MSEPHCRAGWHVSSLHSVVYLDLIPHTPSCCWNTHQMWIHQTVPNMRTNTFSCSLSLLYFWKLLTLCKRNEMIYHWAVCKGRRRSSKAEGAEGPPGYLLTSTKNKKHQLYLRYASSPHQIKAVTVCSCVLGHLKTIFHLKECVYPDTSGCDKPSEGTSANKDESRSR